MSVVRFVLATLSLLAFSLALAGLGDPEEALLAELEAYSPVPTEQGYTAADGFAFDFVSEDGVAVAVTGNGRLSDANVRFVGALLAVASGYGGDIAAPIADFFRTRADDLVGAGPVPIQVVDYDLTATVTGAAPSELELVFEPRRVSETLFPPAAHALGPADAPYVIRVFSDFQCPFCAGFVNNAMPLIESELLTRDDVRFELHHFPLRSIHPNANVAAEAAECVAAEGGEDAFWAFHDELFAQSQRWADQADPVETFLAIAQELDLPSESLSTCLRSGEFSDEVEAAYRAATEGLLLTGTPTVFLNGLKVGDYVDLETYLRLMRLSDALASASEAQTGDDEADEQGADPAGTDAGEAGQGGADAQDASSGGAGEDRGTQDNTAP